MTYAPVSWLNRISAIGLAVAATCLSYAGFLHMFDNGTLACFVAAVIGGGVFGDHCSPISDTTIIASLASGCDHMEHVRTQLPYALIGGTAATALYLVAGLAA